MQFYLLQEAHEGGTTEVEEKMILSVLEKSGQVVTLIEKTDWRIIWDNLSDKNCIVLIKTVGKKYWKEQRYPKKRDEVDNMASGFTSEVEGKAIILILESCSPLEREKIDEEVGGIFGLKSDLSGENLNKFFMLKQKK